MDADRGSQEKQRELTNARDHGTKPEVAALALEAATGLVRRGPVDANRRRKTIVNRNLPCRVPLGSAHFHNESGDKLDHESTAHDRFCIVGLLSFA
jgi:hypothetical protein